MRASSSASQACMHEPVVMASYAWCGTRPHVGKARCHVTHEAHHAVKGALAAVGGPIRCHRVPLAAPIPESRMASISNHVPLSAERVLLTSVQSGMAHTSAQLSCMLHSLACSCQSLSASGAAPACAGRSPSVVTHAWLQHSRVRALLRRS